MVGFLLGWVEFLSMGGVSVRLRWVSCVGWAFYWDKLGIFGWIGILE